MSSPPPAPDPNDPLIFRGLYDAYPDGVLVVDAQGLIVLANPAAASLLGYAASALQGRPVDRLVPDRVAQRHAAYREGYALAPKARPMGTELELMAKRADGSEVMVEIALSPLRVGAADYVVASVRGIGAYPRVKRAMQRARYNEFVVQLGRVAVDTLDPDELLQRMPAVAAQALDADAVSVFLLSPNQLELRIASYSGPQAGNAPGFAVPNRTDTALGYVVAQRVPVVVTNFAREHRFEVPARLVDAGAKSALGVPLNDRGRIIGVLGAWSNQLRKFGDEEVAFLEALASLLSTSLQRAQTEAQLRHAQRLETVGQLTGGIAHDFNNLLTVTQGNLQLLNEQPAVRADALARQLVAAAMRAGQRGADLTGKLLAFARRQSLAPTPVDPVAMLQSMGEMLRRTLGDHIRVLLQLPPSCPRCLADAVQLESALLNVAINARDAMPQGGTLVLRCGAGSGPDPQRPSERYAPACGDAQAAGAPGWVWFSLQDNGSGMSEQVRDRAFEPFFTTKEAGRGTGLGLSTVYGFVKQSHGSVHLDSAPGAGTTVTLVLPAIGEPAAAAALPAAAFTGPPPGLRVLLVEDDADVRGVALSFLQAMGCEVLACASAEAALAEFKRGRTVDLLVSDVRLGAGIDGYALAHRLRAQQPALAVLLTSGYANPLPDGGAAPWPVLNKPYTREQLAQAMTQCLPVRPMPG